MKKNKKMENPKVKIYLDTPKPYYYPGEQYLASILMEVLDTINCNKMTIIAKGKKIIKVAQKRMPEFEEFDESDMEEEEELVEETNNINTINNKKNKHKIEEELPTSDIDQTNNGELKEKENIFKYKKVLNISNNKTLSKGKYIYPFEIDIPENIPGSFLFMENGIYVEIIYSIKIILNDNNINIKEMFPIIIRQKEKIFNYKRENEHSKNIGGCCWEKNETKIKINASDKYYIRGNNIKLNILINNEKCNIQGSPLSIEMYQKFVLFPHVKSKKIKITRLVGQYKGAKEKLVNPKENFNEDISFLMQENKYISDNISKTKAVKYFKNKSVIPLLTPSIKTDFLHCEYEIYVESQFTRWSIEEFELGVFMKVIMYPPEKGILPKNIENLSKEFSNGLVNKKIFLNSESTTTDDVGDIQTEVAKVESKNRKKNEIIKKMIKKDKISAKKNKKVKRNKSKDDDKENKSINSNNYSNINNDDINENFNINAYKNAYYNNNDSDEEEEDDNISIKQSKNNIKKKFNQDFLDDELDNDNLENISNN